MCCTGFEIILKPRPQSKLPHGVLRVEVSKAFFQSIVAQNKN